MHHDGHKMISPGVWASGLSFLLLGGCHTSPPIDHTNADTACEIGASCQISGTLTSTPSLYGDVFLLEDSSLSGQEFCIADGTEKGLSPKTEGPVLLVGELLNRNETDACIYVQYGNSNIPCGYCPGTLVFMATSASN